ncbi:MAG: tetratricopeptide repeat protein [Geopsychrobacter sp.]|nr:tetratricopeptide repeat protein [Geopsychrobacter sp.]
MHLKFTAVRRLVIFLLLLCFCFLLNACGPALSQQAKKKWESVRNLTKAGKPDEAIIKAQKLLQKDPNDAGAAYWLANAYVNKGQAKEAEKTFLRILAMDQPQDQTWIAAAHFKLGRIYQQTKPTAALKHLNQALNISPLWTDPLIIRGWVYIYKGHYREALSYFDHILNNPGLKAATYFTEIPFEGHRGRALALLGLDQADAALTELTLAETSTENLSLEWDRILVYYASGNEEKLQELYEKEGLLNVEIKDYANVDSHTGVEVVAVTVDGPGDWAGLQVGDIILQVGDKSFTNREEFAATVRSFPSGEPVQLRLLRNGTPLKLDAILGSHLAVVMGWAPRQPAIAPLLAQRDTLEQIKKEEQSGNLRAALQLCTEYLKTTDYGSERDPFFKKSIQIALQLDPLPAIPQEAVRHTARAEAYLKSATSNEEFEKALAEFDAALLLAPWWQDVWFNLGIAQKNAGDPGAAIRSLQMFLLAAPDDQAAPKVQREIYALEVEAERNAAQGQWNGIWTDIGNSRYVLHRDGNRITFTYIQPDQADSDVGYRSGGIKFHGTLNGNRLRGKRIFHSGNANGKRCFGSSYERDMSAEMGDNGYVITTHWQISTFLIKSCKITDQEDKTTRYFRMP